MSAVLDEKLCNGCGKLSEPPCVKICPGNLLYKEDKKIKIRDVFDCWDCAACVKHCPRGALYLQLPVAIGGKGAKLRGKAIKNKTLWEVQYPSGRTETYSIRTVNR